MQQTAAIFSNSYVDEYEYRRVHLSLLVLSNHYVYDIKVKQYSVVDSFKSQTSTVALNPMFLVARTNTKLKKSRHYSNHLSLIFPGKSAAPTGLVVDDKTKSEISFSWKHPAFFDIRYYTIYKNGVRQKHVPWHAKTSATLGGLDAGTQYIIEVELVSHSSYYGERAELVVKTEGKWWFILYTFLCCCCYCYCCCYCCYCCYYYYYYYYCCCYCCWYYYCCCCCRCYYCCCCSSCCCCAAVVSLLLLLLLLILRVNGLLIN